MNEPRLIPNHQNELWLNLKPSRREHFLSVMESILPWKALLILLEPHFPHSDKGRPRIELDTLLRCHLLSLFYNLGDEAVEDSIHDSLSFQKFVGLGTKILRVPDERNFRRFREVLNTNDLGKTVLSLVNRSLSERGVKCSTGTMVDATIIPASSSTKNEAKERDPDMGSTQKNNNWHFGAKLHVGADVETRVVHTVSVTSASVADVAEGPDLMRPDDTLGLGDKGYAGMAPEGCQFHIPLKKNQFSEAAKEEAKAYNRKVSSLRARVEHVFHVLKCVFGAKRLRYRGLAKNKVRLEFQVALANLYLCRKQLLAAAAA